VNAPVLPGSTQDVVQFAPTFPAELAKKVFLAAFKVWLAREAARLQNERLKRQQRAAEASRRAWQAYQAAMWAAYNRGRQLMSFGQMGFQSSWPVPTGGDLGGVQDWVDVIGGIGGGIIDWWRNRDVIDAEYEDLRRRPWGGLPGAGYAPTTAPPPTVAQTAAGGLFRPSAQRIVPLNEFSVIGPDGKTHTWLHARPTRWKVNKANVSGRTRRCCRK
jgi:hypothetical protein